MQSLLLPEVPAMSFSVYAGGFEPCIVCLNAQVRNPLGHSDLSFSHRHLGFILHKVSSSSWGEIDKD